MKQFFSNLYLAMVIFFMVLASGSSFAAFGDIFSFLVYVSVSVKLSA